MKRFIAPVLLLASLRAHAQSTPAPVLIDRIVAVVGDRLVLASEVDLEDELSRRDLYTLGPLSPRRADTKAWLVDVAIIRGLAGDVSVYEPTRDELVSAIGRIRATFQDDSDYARFLSQYGITAERLSSLVYGRLVAEHYIQRNVGLGVSDGDLLARYDSWIQERRQQVTIREIEARDP